MPRGRRVEKKGEEHMIAKEGKGEGVKEVLSGSPREIGYELACPIRSRFKPRNRIDRERIEGKR